MKLQTAFIVAIRVTIDTEALIFSRHFCNSDMVKSLMHVYYCYLIVKHYYFLNICYSIQHEVLCSLLAIHDSTVQYLSPTSFLLLNREYLVPVLSERVRDLGYNVVFKLLLNKLGKAQVYF